MVYFLLHYIYLTSKLVAQDLTLKRLWKKAIIGQSITYAVCT